MKQPFKTKERTRPLSAKNRYSPFFSNHTVIFPLIALVLFASLVVGVWKYLGNESVSNLKLRTELTVNQTADRLGDYINVRLGTIRFLRTHYLREPITSYSEYSKEVDDLLHEFKGVQALNYVNKDGVIQWVAPYKPNILALGKDLHTHPMAAPYFNKAEKTGMDVCTNGIKLYQGGVGFATYFPIWKDGKIEGYFNGVFRIKEFFDPLLVQASQSDFFYFLEDGNHQVVLSNTEEGSQRYSPFMVSRSMNILDNTWQLQMVPAPNFVARLQTPGQMLVLYFGLIAAVILSWLYRLSLVRQRNLYDTFALVQSEEENYRSLISNSPFGIAVYRKGRFIYINDAGLRLLGATNEEEFLSYGLEEMVHPDYRKGLVEKISEMVNSPRHVTPLEIKILRFDKEVVDIELDASTIEYEGSPATQIVARDITDRKMAEIARSDSERRYRTLFESSVDSKIVLKNDTVFDCNKTTLTMFGAKRNQIIGEPMTRFSPLMQYDGSLSKNAFKEKIKSAYAGSMVSFDWYLNRLDGSQFDAQVTLNKLTISNDDFLLATIRDVSIEKRVEKVSAVVYQISEALVQTSDLQELYEAIHRYLSSVLDTTNIYIALLDEDHRQVDFAYYIDQNDPNPGPQALSNGLSEYVMRLRKPLLVTSEDMMRLEREGKISLLGTTSKIWLGAPLVAENKTIGIIAVQSYEDENAYDQTDLDVLNFVSEQIALAIARKRAEKEQERQQTLFSQLFNNSPQAIVIVKNDDIVVNVNNGFEELFQYSRDDILDKSIEQHIVPEHLLEESHKLSDTVTQSGVVGTETQRRKKDGTEFDVQVIAFPIIFESEDTHICAIYTDISERIAYQKKVADSEQKFRSLAGELASMNDMKETLLDVISHDLKNPAGVIFGMTDMLLSTEPDNEMLHLVKDSTENLLAVIENATALSRVAFGEDIHKEPLDMGEVVADVVRDYQAEIKQAGMSLDMDLSGDLKLNANLLVAEVIKNYISNAIKYASKGKRIQVLAFRNDGNVIIEVCDFGKTIEKSQINKIFERGVQLSKGKKHGRGLGLAIVKRIAEVHNGTVGVRPNMPHGNIFYFSLPI